MRVATEFFLRAVDDCPPTITRDYVVQSEQTDLIKEGSMDTIDHALRHLVKTRLEAELGALQGEIAILREKNDRLTVERSKLAVENARLEVDLSSLPPPIWEPPAHPPLTAFFWPFSSRSFHPERPCRTN